MRVRHPRNRKRFSRRLARLIHVRANEPKERELGEEVLVRICKDEIAIFSGSAS